MTMTRRHAFCVAAFLAAVFLFAAAHPSRAQNQVLGEVDFKAPTKIDRTSGVWVDGQYVGFVDELKGDKKVLLLPGKHEISIRQSGYLDFNQEVLLEPGKKLVVSVAMQKDPRAQTSAVTSQIKLKVTPDNAAVILDGAFAGNVHEFSGMGRAMLVKPGKHHLKIDLPGYQPFDTEVNLRPHQKITIKTELLPGSITQADPSLKKK
jgi:PEGA domain